MADPSSRPARGLAYLPSAPKSPKSPSGSNHLATVKSLGLLHDLKEYINKVENTAAQQKKDLVRVRAEKKQYEATVNRVHAAGVRTSVEDFSVAAISDMPPRLRAMFEENKVLSDRVKKNRESSMSMDAELAKRNSQILVLEGSLNALKKQLQTCSRSPGQVGSEDGLRTQLSASDHKVHDLEREVGVLRQKLAVDAKLAKQAGAAGAREREGLYRQLIVQTADTEEKDRQLRALMLEARRMHKHLPPSKAALFPGFALGASWDADAAEADEESGGGGAREGGAVGKSDQGVHLMICVVAGGDAVPDGALPAEPGAPASELASVPAPAPVPPTAGSSGAGVAVPHAPVSSAQEGAGDAGPASDVASSNGEAGATVDSGVADVGGGGGETGAEAGAAEAEAEAEAAACAAVDGAAAGDGVDGETEAKTEGGPEGEPEGGSADLAAGADPEPEAGLADFVAGADADAEPEAGSAELAVEADAEPEPEAGSAELAAEADAEPEAGSAELAAVAESEPEAGSAELTAGADEEAEPEAGSAELAAEADAEPEAGSAELAAKADAEAELEPQAGSAELAAEADAEPEPEAGSAPESTAAEPEPEVSSAAEASPNEGAQPDGGAHADDEQEAEQEAGVTQEEEEGAAEA